MWLDLQKGVFHTHPFYQLRWFVTSDWQKLLTWNLVSRKHQHRLMTGASFRFICLLITKLWSLKFNKLDVCGRPLFANPVTNCKCLLCVIYPTTSLKQPGKQFFLMPWPTKRWTATLVPMDHKSHNLVIIVKMAAIILIQCDIKMHGKQEKLQCYFISTDL